MVVSRTRSSFPLILKLEELQFTKVRNADLLVFILDSQKADPWAAIFIDYDQSLGIMGVQLRVLSSIEYHGKVGNKRFVI